MFEDVDHFAFRRFQELNLNLIKAKFQRRSGGRHVRSQLHEGNWMRLCEYI